FENALTALAEGADRQRSQAYLRAVAQRIQSLAGVAAETAVLEDIHHAAHHGEPGVVASPRRAVAHALAAAAEQPGVELVAMTTHGRSDISRFWLGSVTEHLIHHAPAPLLLVQPGSAAPDLAASVAFRRILVPLDGSQAAEQMLERAIAFGQPWGACYYLLHAIDLQLEETIATLAPVPTTQSEIETEAEQARAYMEQAARPLHDRQLDVKTDVLLGTPVAAVILGYAAERQVDLIAIKTHGRGGFARLVLGSTADKVLRAAQVPVLLHRPALAPARPAS
ncbi:MAG TPA: universal stress protein, partial [Kouleothrix sp.]|nr:universal stress protein [Kouleothrix sp.]